MPHKISKKFWLKAGVLALAVFIVLVFSGLRCQNRTMCGRPPEPSEIKLTFWGLWDNSDIYAPIIEAYTEKHKNVTVEYKKFTPEGYEEMVRDALAAGRGPDIFLIHNTWLPRWQDKIYPLPQDTTDLLYGQDPNVPIISEAEPALTAKRYQETFVDVASYDFMRKETVEEKGKTYEVYRIYAVPLSVDTLALFYNKDLFNAAGIPEPPSDWREFRDDVMKLTQIDQNGQIVVAGAAMGGTDKNINRATDILFLLMLQNGTQMVANDFKSVSFASEQGKNAVQFYTDFADVTKKVYTWNPRQHYSLDAFAEGNVAMIFNYAYNIPLIQAKSRVNFGIAPMPQMEGATKLINYANYWGLTVSQSSPNAQAAWDFIKFIALTDQLKNYLDVTKNPASRRDLILSQKDDPQIGTFATQALSALSWYQIDNRAIERIFNEMIENIILGRDDIDRALRRAQEQINTYFAQ